jgi:hypothetical protein
MQKAVGAIILFFARICMPPVVSSFTDPKGAKNPN